MQKNRMIVKGLFVMSLGLLMGLSVNAMDRAGIVGSDKVTIQVSHQKKRAPRKKNSKKNKKQLLSAQSLEIKNEAVFNRQLQRAKAQLHSDHIQDDQYAKEKKGWKNKDRAKNK